MGAISGVLGSEAPPSTSERATAAALADRDRWHVQEASAIVRRLAVEDQRTDASSKSTSQVAGFSDAHCVHKTELPVETLLNLLYTPDKESGLWQLSQLLLRLDSLSHVL
eukprot:COSAG06_NODE_49047_length_328_cov_0.659389_1_plen_109_part_11